MLTDEPEPEPAAPALPPLRRNWRFQALWIGSTSAALGVDTADVAYPLLILFLTGSPALAGLFGFVQAAALTLSSLPAGWVIDRVDRRRVLLCAEVGRAAATGLVAWSVADGRVSVPLLIVVAALLGVGSTFGGPVRMLMIRAVVHPQQLTKALAQDEVREGATGLIGPPLGGSLYGVARALPFLVCSVSFVISFFCALIVRPPAPLKDSDDAGGADGENGSEPAEQGGKPAKDRGGLLTGLNVLWANHVVRGALLIVAVFYLTATAVTLVVVVSLHAHHTASGLIGVALSGMAVGMLLGAPLIERLHRRLSPGKLLIIVSTVMTGCLALLVVQAGPWWIFGVLIASALTLPALRVLIDIMIFRQVPDERRGRAIVATMTVLSVGPPLGTLAAGLLLEFAGVTGAVLTLAGLQAAATLYGLSNRKITGARWPAG
jgi:MFS family permease